MRLFTSCLVLVVLALSAQLGFAREDWELRKDEQGIKVYTRSVKGSNFKAFKGVATLNAPLASFVAVLKDADAFSEWMPNVKQSALLQSEETEQYHYLETHTPWPVSNRDGAYHFVFNHEPAGGVLTIRVKAVPEYVPEESGKVRIPWVNGFWKFTPSGDGSVSVVYQLHADPGGTLPGWLANRTVVDTPFNMLKSLSERVKLEQYQNAAYPFLTKLP